MQNQFKRMKLSNTYECDQCIRKFDTGVQLRNHKRIHAGIIETSTVSDNMATTRVLPTADAAPTGTTCTIQYHTEGESTNSTIYFLVSFNPGEPRTFKASCNFGPDDEGHVYNEASIQDHAFTTSQMMSIQLYDIITSFQVSSECHRQIVHLMNTVIRDHDKLAEEYNPHIRHAGPVSTLLKEKTSIKAHEFPIGSRTTMKMMSVGDQLSKLLSHEETREKLRYRHDRKATPGIISDYFDGEDYKALKNANLFQSPDDIAIALFVDGFVNQKKSKQEMTIVHVLVMNFDPSIRYTDQYMFQLAIIPGKPKDLDSFLLPIIDEIKSLGEHGLIVERWNGETIKAKVHLVMATGDIPQVTKYMHHGGHMATYGCRVCLVEVQKRECTGYGMYFQKRGASLRTVDHFVNGDEEHHIKNANLISALPSFCGSSYYGLDEMHLLGQGIGRFIFDVIVKVNQSSDTSYYSKKQGNFNKDAYTFKVSKKQLELVGDCITKSRANIPVSFQGSWDNLLSKIDGARAINFLDFLLYVVPTLLVPLFEKKSVRKALLMLTRGCAIALQWEQTDSMILEMESCFRNWHNFLDVEISNGNLSNSIFKPNNHYLSHIGFITRKAGCMRSYSARSMERTIRKYFKLIKSKVHAGTNAGNMVERLSIRGYVNLALDTVSLLESITPIKTSLDDFIELPPTAIHNQNHQLWSPFITITTTSSNLVDSMPINTFIRELKIYYGRSTRSIFASITIHNLTIKMAARALLFSNIITSRMHRRIRAEHRRGNRFVLFHANYKSKICWYVGSVNFYFEHNNSTDPNN
ncbi:hypothetical protein INT47_012016, partial [Mucor saturninus]